MAPSTRFYDNPTFAQKPKLWEPFMTLKIINTDPGYQRMTCVGYAPSKGRRCRNSIRSDNRDLITATLNEIACLKPSNPVVLSRLREIAGRALCVGFHQGQAESVVLQWRREIQQVEVNQRAKERRQSKLVRDDTFQDSNQTMSELQEQLKHIREMLAQLQDERSSYADPPQQCPGPNEQARQEERKSQEREERNREARRQEEERLERDRLEAERLEKERIKKEREEIKRREQAAHKERIRQRAQILREEREREKREAERREEEEWTRAWMKYQERWADFKPSTGSSREGNIRDAIPWPVKSGSFLDVNPSDVAKFLGKAVARDISPVKLIRKECKKWHPDCIYRLLRDAHVTDADRLRIDMICRVLTDLLNNASGKSSECLD
jgi:hypothetical protein